MNNSSPSPDQHNKSENLVLVDTSTNNCLQSPSSSLSSTSTSTISSPNFNSQSNSSKHQFKQTNKSSEGNLQKLAINNISSLNRTSTPILANVQNASLSLNKSKLLYFILILNINYHLIKKKELDLPEKALSTNTSLANAKILNSTQNTNSPVRLKYLKLKKEKTIF